MARRKKIKNFNRVWPSFMTKLKDAILRKAASLVVMAIFLATVFLMGSSFLLGSDYFRVDAIESSDISTNGLMKSYKGVNIFKINLKRVAESLEDSYPNVRVATVKIVLPDKLAVDLKFRKPFAQINGLFKIYPIDEEGVVLSGLDAATLANLPTITGINLGRDAIGGKRLESKNLKAALALLAALKNSPFMARYVVSGVNAQDMKNMSFNLKDGPEVKIGSQEFTERLKAFDKTFNHKKLILQKKK